MQSIRNIAIIAHVDHGKTTLVDKILHQSNLFRDNQDTGDLILDSNPLERERGITILAKNVSVRYGDTKINIIDTPGHADFGGEVERVLNMADGVLLLVDAFEGAMPQTRFVLQKALELGKKAIVVINKIDKPNCHPDIVHDQIFELFYHLNATEEQLNFPTLFGSSKQGWMSDDWQKPTENLIPLFEAIIKHIPAPLVLEGTPQMQITTIDYSAYTGRIAIGRLLRGTLREGMNVSLVKRDGVTITKSRIKELYTFEGLARKKTAEVEAGDICAIFGIEDFEIGDTVADFENPEGLKPIAIDEPTMSMLFTINNSPFFGKEGKFVTSRHLRERLEKEIEKNLALRIEDTDSPDSILVYGRGILHLSILIETMRREGFEMQVGQPKVIVKEINGVKCEPIEILTVNTPAEYSGKAIELVSARKGEMLVMEPKGDIQHLEFQIPSRGLVGLRNTMLTASAGEAIIAHRFKAFEPWRGNIPGRNNGVLIAMEKGRVTAYSLDNLQDRGSFFVENGNEVYAGQVIGAHIRPGDLVVNAVKTKKLSNMRASGTDDAARIAPKIDMSLEECLEFIQEDEYVEVTPKSLRLRKISLDHNERQRRTKEMAVVVA
ncbi:MAG TPA: translational GTPase TypA [Chitinophagales bacterium]|nr:translational GTPase TypA [Chitinophagales bacterium]